MLAGPTPSTHSFIRFMPIVMVSLYWMLSRFKHTGEIGTLLTFLKCSRLNLIMEHMETETRGGVRGLVIFLVRQADGHIKSNDLGEMFKYP